MTLRLLEAHSLYVQKSRPGFGRIHKMRDPTDPPRDVSAKSAPSLPDDDTLRDSSATAIRGQASSSHDSNPHSDLRIPLSPTPPSPAQPPMSRHGSFSGSSSRSYQEDWEVFPPLERLTVFDLLDSLSFPQRFGKWQNSLAAQTEKVRRQREKLKSSGSYAKERVVEEWRRRLPTPDEQLNKYRKVMRESVDRLGSRWNDTKAVTLWEKVSFIAGVLNIFISGYIIGAHPDFFYWWFTAQLTYFMPIRWYTYQKKGYHYFLADLCYFVNFLLLLSIWGFPNSKRLFISTYCLAYGNNAVAIAMWRNSMVFHSMEKTVR